MRLPTSYSRDKQYNTCPLQMYYTVISVPKLKGGENEAMRRGGDGHKTLEKAMKNNYYRIPAVVGNYDKPIMLQHLIPFIANLKASYLQQLSKALLTQPGNKSTHPDFISGVEQEWAFNYELEPVRWMAINVWMRIKIDVALIMAAIAIIVDWKTGRVNPDPYQLSLYAGGVFAKYPKVNKVVCMFVWVDHPGEKPTVMTFYREQYSELWREWYERSLMIEESVTTNNWPAVENGFCKSCPVSTQKLPQLCQYAVIQ